MSEYRKDPFTGRWRLVAEGRSARPNEYGTRAPPVATDANCPFCEGHETQTPPEVGAVRAPGAAANGPGWTVRAFANKFPSVGPAPRGRRSASLGAATTMPGAGVHEVVVEDPHHSPDLPYLPDDQLTSLFRFLRDRTRYLGERPGIRSVLLFENRGPESGGTLPHPHAQLVATALLPPRLEEEQRAFDRARSEGERGCLLEAIVRSEVADGTRWVADEGPLVAYAPFASEFPYEVWIAPKRHAPSFGRASDAEVDALARLLPALLRALDAVRPRSSYNWFVHGLAPRGRSVGGFHWHVEVAPRLLRADGFELGSGVSVNPVLPETAAREYRERLAADPRLPRPKR